MGQRKILSPHKESNLRPSDLRSDALPLSHKDSSVSGIYYEVLMTRGPHTARISKVDSVMFLTEKTLLLEEGGGRKGWSCFMIDYVIQKLKQY